VAKQDPLVLRIIDPVVELLGKVLKGGMAFGMFLAVMTLGIKAWYTHRYYQWKENR